MRREGRIPKQRYVLELITIPEANRPAHMPNPRGLDYVQHVDVRNIVNTTGSNHTKADRPFKIVGGHNEHYPRNKSRPKSKGEKGKRWAKGLVGTLNPDSGLSDPSSPHSWKAQGIAVSLDSEEEFEPPPRVPLSFQFTLPVSVPFSLQGNERSERRKQRHMPKQVQRAAVSRRDKSTGFRMYEQACKERPMFVPASELAPNEYAEAVPQGTNPLTYLGDLDHMEDAAPSESCVCVSEPDSELDDFESDSEDWTSGSECHSTFSFMPLEIPAQPAESSLVSPTAVVSKGPVGPEMVWVESSGGSESEMMGEWDLVSDDGSWDEIFDESDLS